MGNCDICKDQDMLSLFEIEGRKIYRCKKCGLEKVYPKPSKSELKRIYDDDYYKAWGMQEDVVGAVKKETFRNHLNLIPSCRGAKILDCGCATGYFLEVAKDCEFLPYGIEINEVAVNIAKKKFSPDQIYLGSIESCPFKEDSFYAIFMSDFLEHVEDPLNTLKKAYALLKSYGYLVITTPNTNSFSHKIMQRLWPHYKLEHLFYFNEKNINLLFKKVGFKVISINKAWKCLTLDYIKSYFIKYPCKGLTSLLRKIIGLLPYSFRYRKMWCYFGEMVVVALKL